MPEGDAVRRTANRLHAALAGMPLVHAELRWPGLGGVDLAGRTVVEVVSYGKHLLLRLAAVGARRAVTAGGASISRGPALPSQPAPTTFGGEVPAMTLHAHLRMDGKWVIRETTGRWPSASNDAVRAVLANERWTAVGEWLGMLDLVPTAAEHTLLGHLGPDLMADDFLDSGLPIALQRFARHPERTIGQALLDQTNVAGIGTMYLAESLFRQRISPWTPTAEVDVAALLLVARRQMLAGVAQPIPNTTGDTRFHETHYAHARSGRPCRRCGTTIRVASVGEPSRERPAFYCPTCQLGPFPTDDGRPQGPLGSVPATPWSRRNAGMPRRRPWESPRS